MASVMIRKGSAGKYWDMTWGGARPTRFDLLRYAHTGPDTWRFIVQRDWDANGGAEVGPCYRTKAELLADVERYAGEYGAVA